MNLFASRGVAVREFPLETGKADYLLFVDRKAVGIVEAKPEGMTLAGVAEQAGQYAVGLPDNIPHVTLPLPFQYESTGVETLFRDNRDPAPRSRRVFTFHRPETLADWASDASTFRSRLQQMPPGEHGRVVESPGRGHPEPGSLAGGSDRPRALIQMATGSRQDLHGGQFHLPADQVRQGAAGALPGGSQQPGSPDAQGVRGLCHPG